MKLTIDWIVCFEDFWVIWSSSATEEHFLDMFNVTSHTTSPLLSSDWFHCWLKRKHKLDLDSDKPCRYICWYLTLLIVKPKITCLLGFCTLGVVVHAFSSDKKLSRALKEPNFCPDPDSIKFCRKNSFIKVIVRTLSHKPWSSCSLTLLWLLYIF